MSRQCEYFLVASDDDVSFHLFPCHHEGKSEKDGHLSGCGCGNVDKYEDGK